MSATDIQIVNAGLTRAGYDQITAFDDGSAEAEVANANYERVVRAALTKYPWSWSSTYEEIDRLSETPINQWDYVYTKPAAAIKITNILRDGNPVDYEQRGSKIYCNEEDDLVADYIFRSGEDEWSDDFIEALTQRFEGLFLRSLAEKHSEAAARDDAADVSFKLAYNNDAKNKTPRDRRTSRLVNVRA